MRLKVSVIVAVITLFAVSVVAAKDHKPRRGKHYLKPGEFGTETVEDLKEVKVEEEESFFDEIKTDSRVKSWVSWWRTCDPSFSVDKFVDRGVFSMDDEWVPYERSEIAGPNKEFLTSKGGYTMNPVWGRMRYVKRDKHWQAEMRNHWCGVMLYKGDRACKVIRCGELDGVFQGFWVGSGKFVILAYRKISPEMDARCKAKEVGECVAPVLWLGDMKSRSVWEYGGTVVTFSKCEPNAYLTKLYPEFFVQDDSVTK